MKLLGTIVDSIDSATIKIDAKITFIFQPNEISSCLVELWPYPAFVVRQGFELGIWVGLVGDVGGPGLPRPARLDVDGVRGPGDPGSNLRPLDYEPSFYLSARPGSLEISQEVTKKWITRKIAELK